MAECICSDIIGKFADECTGVVVDSLGNTYYRFGVVSRDVRTFLNKASWSKSVFRKVDQNRLSCSNFLASALAAVSHPAWRPIISTIGNGFFVVINGCVDSNLPHSRSDVFCGTSKSVCDLSRQGHYQLFLEFRSHGCRC